MEHYTEEAQRQRVVKVLSKFRASNNELGRLQLQLVERPDIYSMALVRHGDPISAQVNSPLSNRGQFSGIEISPPEGPGQNTYSHGDVSGPNRSNLIPWWLLPYAGNLASNAMVRTVNISGPSLDPSSIQSSMSRQVGLSGRTNHQNFPSELNTGRSQDDFPIDVEAQISAQVNPPLSNIDQNSPPEGQAQNTGILGYIVDRIFSLNLSNWIRPSALLDAYNFVSNAMVGVNNLPGALTDVVHFNINGSNGIGQLVFLAGCNFVSHATVAVYYLPGDLQEVHETFWRAQLIASVAAPIAVAVVTLLSSFWFASDPEGWSNWITGLSWVNAVMNGGGPLAFYWMRNRGTKN